MDEIENKAKEPKTYVISLLNRKARGCGHERCEEILAAARALFLEHGVENVTTRQIACRVGISQTALYVYFKNKEEILDKAVVATLDKLSSGLNAVDGQCADPVEFLRAMFRAYVHFALEHPDDFRLVFMLRSARREAGGDIVHKKRPVAFALLDLLERRIEQGVASGALRDLKSPRGVAQSVWASMHGLVSLVVAYPEFDWVATDALIDLNVEMLLDGLLRRDGRKEAVTPSLEEAVASAPSSKGANLTPAPILI